LPIDISPPPNPWLIRLARKVHPKEDEDGNDPRQEILKKGALDLTGIGHAIFLQLICQLRIDPRCHELALAVRERFFQLALDVAVGNPKLGDFPVLQKLLELAVRDWFNPLCHGVKILEDQDAEFPAL
jgi:hypothetical protein